MNINNQKIKSRKKRIRLKIRGTKERPRLSVFRSNLYIYAQLINDEKGETLLSISDKDMKEKQTRIDKAKKTGIALAKKALDKKISSVVFDKGGYSFHGIVKAFADGAREGGLKF